MVKGFNATGVLFWRSYQNVQNSQILQMRVCEQQFVNSGPFAFFETTQTFRVLETLFAYLKNRGSMLYCLRFLPIFGEKMAFFLIKNNMNIFLPK
jgi:hypothetical protein